MPRRRNQPDLFSGIPIDDPPLDLPPASEADEIRQDYEAMGFTLRRHPMALLRPNLAAQGCITTEAMRRAQHGRTARVTGLVTLRQRPGTAKGTIFLTLEDETGLGNVIVWPTVYADYRIATLNAVVLQVTGRVQREGIVINLIAAKLVDESHLLRNFNLASRDFR